MNNEHKQNPTGQGQLNSQQNGDVFESDQVGEMVVLLDSLDEIDFYAVFVADRRIVQITVAGIFYAIQESKLNSGLHSIHHVQVDVIFSIFVNAMSEQNGGQALEDEWALVQHANI